MWPYRVVGVDLGETVTTVEAVLCSIVHDRCPDEAVNVVCCWEVHVTKTRSARRMSEPHWGK